MEILYAPLDWILGWASYLPPFWALTTIGVVTGLAVDLIQKYFSNQSFIEQCKADLKLLKQRIKNTTEKDRLRAVSGRITGKYILAAFKPALVSIPLIGLVAMWAGSRMAYEPVRPEQKVEVRAYFEDRALGMAYLMPSDGLAPVGPAISSIEVPKNEEGRQARWTIRAAAEGKHTLAVRYADHTYPIEVLVSQSGGRPPEAVTLFSDATPLQDHLQAIEFKLTPVAESAWWNLWLEWVGWYMLVATLVAVALRPIVKVQ